VTVTLKVRFKLEIHQTRRQVLTRVVKTRVIQFFTVFTVEMKVTSALEKSVIVSRFVVTLSVIPARVRVTNVHLILTMRAFVMVRAVALILAIRLKRNASSAVFARTRITRRFPSFASWRVVVASVTFTSVPVVVGFATVFVLFYHVKLTRARFTVIKKFIAVPAEKSGVALAKIVAYVIMASTPHSTRITPAIVDVDLTVDALKPIFTDTLPKINLVFIGTVAIVLTIYRFARVLFDFTQVSRVSVFAFTSGLG
jgi:hypothetical protein